MSRWGLAKILDRYIIQVPIIIFQDIFSKVSFLSPKYIYFIIQNNPLFVVKVNILHFCRILFLSYPSHNFVWRHLLPKKGTYQPRLCRYTREIPCFTDVSFSAVAWKKNFTNYTKSLNGTCVPYSLSYPNVIEFLNIIIC